MMAAIKETVTVRPGGVVAVEVHSPYFIEGATAEVIVLVRRTPPRRTLVSFIGAGKGLFGGPDEVDAYVRGLRDEWDR